MAVTSVIERTAKFKLQLDLAFFEGHLSLMETHGQGRAEVKGIQVPVGKDCTARRHDYHKCICAFHQPRCPASSCLLLLRRTGTKRRSRISIRIHQSLATAEEPDGTLRRLCAFSERATDLLFPRLGILHDYCYNL